MNAPLQMPVPTYIPPETVNVPKRRKEDKEGWDDIKIPTQDPFPPITNIDDLE